MSFANRESSRSLGEPIELYLFKGADPSLESLMRSVTVAPGTTEFGYGTTKVTKDGQSANAIANQPVTDFKAAINDLTASATDLAHVSLVVGWHGSDLRAANCQIRPKVETAASTDAPYAWQVGPTTRSTAQVVSQIGGKPAVGGAPADRSVYEALIDLKGRGLRVTLYPFVFMDIAAGNSLPNPYGGVGQATYPWRGRITCDPAPGQPGTVDKTAASDLQVATFFGNAQPSDFAWDATNLVVQYSGPDEWSFRRFILHMATIAQAAGVDDFLIGSGMVGLTSIRSSSTDFPAIGRMIDLANLARTKLGSGVRISYAADWSEYHSYRPADGSGDVFFNLDPLWAAGNINFVGIDNYLPIADWRNDDTHLDRQAGYLSGYEKRYLQANIEGGEYYDWFYANSSARNAQIRTPIVDESDAEEDWVWRQKDLRNWWSNAHHNRPGGVRAGSATPWAAQSKPIVFTEIGCGSVNNGANQPNLVVDPKSSESGLPYFSNGRPDPSIQRAYLEAWLDYWRPEVGNNPISPVYGGRMLEMETASIWTWDARPYPAFPNKTDYWSDAANWQLGHWINGRIYAGSDFDSGILGPYAYTDGEQPVTRHGVTYQPLAIQREAINASGTLDKAMLKVVMQEGEAVGDLFLAYPPSQVVNLIIMQGHVGDDPDVVSNFPVIWTGRVLGCAHPPNETEFTCEPISTAIKRPGLRRNYQIGCPHVLYGSQCRANRKRATLPSTVSAIVGSRITLPSGWNGAYDPSKFAGGMLSWTAPNDAKILRTILRVESANVLLLAGTTAGLTVGQGVGVILGCNRQMDDCANLHANILNYGGQPWIPLVNPIGPINNFY